MKLATLLILLATAILVAGCGASSAPEDTPFASLAGMWRLDECTAERIAPPSGTVSCLQGVTLGVDSTGYLRMQSDNLPGEDPPPVFGGQLERRAGIVTANLGGTWVVELQPGGQMEWSTTATWRFPPSTEDVPATLVQVWVPLPNLPMPSLR